MASQPIPAEPAFPGGPVDDPVPTPVDPIPPTPTDPVVDPGLDYPTTAAA
jgi:hypothetical protein